MKTLLLSLLLLMPVTALAGDGTPRQGSRCPDEYCFEQQRAFWRIATANANAKYSARVSKMLGKWTAKDFDDQYISKQFAKIHKLFVADMRRAGDQWFFEVQGYPKDRAHEIEDQIINDAEFYINQAIIGVWLRESNQ